MSEFRATERHTRGREISVLLSLLGLYVAIIFIVSSPVLQGDEGGYVENATRMLRGQAVTPEDLRLWWGPGYPFVLLPFVAFGAPWIAAKLLNAVFLVGAISYVYALLSRYLTRRPALITTVCLGLYPPLMRDARNKSRIPRNLSDVRLHISSLFFIQPAKPIPSAFFRRFRVSCLLGADQSVFRLRNCHFPRDLACDVDLEASAHSRTNSSHSAARNDSVCSIPGAYIPGYRGERDSIGELPAGCNSTG